MHEIKNNILEGSYSLRDLKVTVHKPMEISFWCDTAARRKSASMPVRSWELIGSVNKVVTAMPIKLFKRVAKGSKSDLMPGYDPIETEVGK